MNKALKIVRYIALFTLKVALYLPSAILLALSKGADGRNPSADENYLDIESHPTVTGENDLITGSFNYRTWRFDDGTDPYGRYSKDLFNED